MKKPFMILVLLVLGLVVSACGDDGGKPPETACSNGVDDDGNGKTDCADPACAATAVCNLSSTKSLTAFAFKDASNPALTVDVTAIINGNNIAATVPSGTDVSALVATFTSTGKTVAIGGVVQESGVTANNFAGAVTYTVTAEDATAQSYVVTVTVAPTNAKDITAFSFTDAANPALSADVVATITGTSIAATVPAGTNVTALVATFTTTGASVRVGGTTQTSGTTPNNFSNPVNYVAVAGDGSTKSYTVVVTVAIGTAKDITSFQFLSANNGGLAADVTATITGTAIAATVPTGTNVSALVATFATTGVSVTVGGTPQVSGTTQNNFGSPVMYVVTAGDTSTKTYTVTVTVAASSAKDITAFSFTDAANAALTTDVTATITGTAIAATVPSGTDVTALVATFSTTGASVKVGAAVQASGLTPNNFTSPVTYTVTAADTTTKTYTVTVTVAPSAAKDITAFSFTDAANAALSADVTATITGTAIAATVPAGTDVTALVATFTTTGASVKVGATVQTSGTTPNDFTSPVAYTVTAADTTTQTYTVTVTVAAAAATIPDGTYTWDSWTCAHNASTIDIKAAAQGLGIMEIRKTYAGGVGSVDSVVSGTCTRSTALTGVTYPTSTSVETTTDTAFTCSATCTAGECTAGSQAAFVDTFSFTLATDAYSFTRTIPSQGSITLQQAAGCAIGDVESGTDTKL